VIHNQGPNLAIVPVTKENTTPEWPTHVFPANAIFLKAKTIVRLSLVTGLGGGVFGLAVWYK
jgi:hypothetical protein